MNVHQSDNALANDTGSSNPFTANTSSMAKDGPTARSASLLADLDAAQRALQSVPPAPKAAPLEDDKPFVWVSF